jgi:dienelactone hydrolase
MRRRSLLALLSALFLAAPLFAEDAQPLPGTQPLTMEGDIAAQLVEGVDKFLLKKIRTSAAARDQSWPTKFTSDQERVDFFTAKRKRLAKLLGAHDEGVKFDAPEFVGTTARPALIHESDSYKVYTVRWPTVRDLHAEGLLVVPNASDRQSADVILVPDADVTPEQMMGLEKGLSENWQVGKALAQQGFRVLIPAPINRHYEARNGRAKMTNREFIYRPSFEFGRHLIGYEVQAVRAGVDWMTKSGEGKQDVRVAGIGEGGMIAFYAAAIDPRIRVAAIDGYFARKEDVWRQPIDRNLFGVLNEFGDAEVSRLVDGALHVSHDNYPHVMLPSEGGAPGELRAPEAEDRSREETRALQGMRANETRNFAKPSPKDDARMRGTNFTRLLLNERERGPVIPPQRNGAKESVTKNDSAARQSRLMHAMNRDTQQLLTESPYVRAEFMKGLDTSSPEAYAKTVEVYREKFKREVIGWFDDERLPFNPRTRKIFDKEKYVGYEVVLDVWPDVIAYGILLLPKDMKADEQRPVVVCQHGLEGRPQDIVQGDHPAYHDFAAKLAERGFITFSPQNLYIGKDKFRTLQRKANPLGKTLFSIIIPQHQQIVDWLKTQPNVDDKRIAFYGLSYGGKSAMRIPPLVPDYCLSICSADFNEWVWKNASTRSPYSYVWTNEYEIFEWDLGSTFNYAEMAALIAPRPFMVERGHADGVAPDETVGYEFAKVYNLYNARLKVGDRCEIEWFDGPHTINGKGTFKFLHKHLKWPEPKL